jgi:hypothetical protein
MRFGDDLAHFQMDAPRVSEKFAHACEEPPLVAVD